MADKKEIGVCKDCKEYASKCGMYGINCHIFAVMFPVLKQMGEDETTFGCRFYKEWV